MTDRAPYRHDDTWGFWLILTVLYGLLSLWG